MRAQTRPVLLEPSLLIHPVYQANVFKDLEENVRIMVHLRNIYVDIFLIDPIFILQIIYFCTGCLSRCNEILIQALTFHADQDEKGFRLSISRVTKREQSRHYPRLILLLHQDTVRSSWMLRKYHETSVIVLCLERM